MVARAETPFEIVPGAPMIVTSNVGAVFDGSSERLHIIADSRNSFCIIACANTVLSNVNRFFVFVPKAHDVFMKSGRRVLPHIVERLSALLKFLRRRDPGHRKWVESYPSVIAHAEKVCVPEQVFRV